MKDSVKQNLIPEDVREKYSMKYLIGFVVLLSVILVISIAIPYISMGIVKSQIGMIESENNEYNYTQTEISGINADIDIYKNIIEAYKVGNFPFYQFMHDLEVLRPATVHIISVDTQDRLINEGVQDEEEKKTTEKDAELAKLEDKKKNEENPESIEPESVPVIKYEKDLCQQSITIRGYGSSQSDISNYLHSISELSYITKINVVAIEEHKIENGIYNIFEITVEGWPV